MKPSSGCRIPSPLLAAAAVLLTVGFLTAGLAAPAAASPASQALDPTPPDHVVKLIFIHHSCGENWLRDDHGGLGLALAQNNYFVSDTNYGWGPDAIGDRTDIPDWLEWFRSENTDRYMRALMEESRPHSDYTRPLADPGGENEIILFKSCFPNSDLYGHPDDPAAPGTDLTVANARYVYNEILQYFATRPDRLFVVITAPPLIDSDNAKNARAFNNWLVYDWLEDNNYPFANVAVFDFYNVLTGPDNHHRFDGSGIEHTYREGMNTAYYPSSPGDDHPSPEGNRRATEEFVPLLNVYFNRWRAASPTTAPAASPLAPASEQPAASPPAAGLIDDFEGGTPAGSRGWEAFRDEASSARLTCTPVAGEASQGSGSMQLEFDIPAGSWATCALMFDEPQDWSAAEGLAFSLHSGSPALVFNVDLYTGPPAARQTYLYTIETTTTTTETWVRFGIRWEEFRRAEWEENAGAPFASPNQVTGIAFGFTAHAEAPNAGVIWVDDLNLLGAPGPGSASQPTVLPQAPAGQPPSSEETPAAWPSLPCLNVLLLLPLLAWLTLVWRLSHL